MLVQLLTAGQQADGQPDWPTSNHPVTSTSGEKFIGFGLTRQQEPTPQILLLRVQHRDALTGAVVIRKLERKAQIRPGLQFLVGGSKWQAFHDATTGQQFSHWKTPFGKMLWGNPSVCPGRLPLR